MEATATKYRTVRLVEEADKPIIASWWKKLAGEIDIDWLPTTTVVLEIGGKLAYAIPVFITNSNRAYTDDIVSDPELSKDDRKGALEVLLQYVEMMLKEFKVEVLFGCAPNDKLLKRYESLGFGVLHKGTTIISKGV